MTDTAEPKLYWIAVRGAAVPSTAMPATTSEMRRASVHVGSPGESTAWLIPGLGANLPSDVAGMTSNYDALVGFRTLEEQRRAQHVLLTASADIATAEALRLRREEVVIWGKGKRPAP